MEMERPTEKVETIYSINDAVDRVGYGKFQVILTCIVGLAWLADAIEIIILSIIGDFIACDWPLQRWQNALFTTTVFGGMMVGSPIFGTIADIHGRKKSLAASAVLLFIFGMATAASPSFLWMAILRCCLGFALGGVAQGLTLCSEYFPSNIRGKAGFYLCYFWSLGTLSVILIAWIIMEYFDSWRILLVATTLPALLVVLTLKWLPESARYFLVSDQYDRAKKILEKMASMNGKDLPPGDLAHVSHFFRRGRIADLLTKNYRRTTLLFWYIWLAVSFAYYGICLISPIIIQHGYLRIDTKGNSSNSSSFLEDMTSLVPCTKFTQRNYIDLLWTSAAEFPGLVLFTFLIEHISRKLLLSAACAISGVLVFLLLLETQFYIIILLCLFGARALLLAVFQMIFVMTSEAFPTTLRAIGMGTSAAFSRLGGLIVPYVAQVLVIQNPFAAISVLSGVTLLAAVAAAFLPLETRGVHMQESQGLKR